MSFNVADNDTNKAVEAFFVHKNWPDVFAGGFGSPRLERPSAVRWGRGQ